MTDPGGPTRTADDAVRRPAGPAAVAAWFVVVEALLVLTTVPALAWLLLLDQRWSNAPWMVVLTIPVGPAVSAALYAWRHYTRENTLGPAAAFWRGYRVNWRDSLRLWVPSLVVLVLLGVNVANLRTDDDAPVVFAVVGVLALAMVAVWAAHAVLVVSLFRFRTSDVVRIGVFFVVAKPVASLVALAIVGVGVAAAWIVGPWLPVLLGSVATYLLWRNGIPLAAEVERRFVVGAPDAPTAKPWQGLPDADQDADDQPDDHQADDQGADDEGADDQPDDHDQGADA